MIQDCRRNRKASPRTCHPRRKALDDARLAAVQVCYDALQSRGYDLSLFNSAQITAGGLPFAPPNDPMFVWRDTDFWVQTIDVGLNFAY